MGRLSYLATDHLGSIREVMKADGDLTSVFHADYDAWGRQTVSRDSIGIYRGYTGHEMLPEFGLINMNGRMYDPLLGRFLSPDNYVQLSDFSQSFNRYSYCLNNPLKYTDPSGEVWWAPIVAGAAIGAALSATTYTLSNIIMGESWNSHQFWHSVEIGAFSGALGGAIGLGGSLLAKTNPFWASMSNSYGYSLLSQTTTSIVTDVVYADDINFDNIGGILLGAIVGTALPTYHAVKGSPFLNAIAEIGFNTARGALTGIVQGTVNAYKDEDVNVAFHSMVGGAISGAARSLTFNVIFGPPYIPKHEHYAESGIFRTGGLANLFSSFFNSVNGITLGRHVYVSDSSEYIDYHEIYHIVQQNSEDYGGWAGFYGRMFYYYLRGIIKENPLDKEADYYMNEMKRMYYHFY